MGQWRLRECTVPQLDALFVVDGDELRAMPIVAITGNVVRHRGKGLHRHAGKTETSLRIVPLPRFVVEMLTKREQNGPEVPVFPAAALRGGFSWKEPTTWGTSRPPVPIASWRRTGRRRPGRGRAGLTRIGPMIGRETVWGQDLSARRVDVDTAPPRTRPFVATPALSSARGDPAPGQSASFSSDLASMIRSRRVRAADGLVVRRWCGGEAGERDAELRIKVGR